MASKSGIRAAKAFVEFSADLSSLPGDFQDAESQFKAFKDRVNKRDSLSSVRADLDTRAAEGKLTSLQSKVRDALDPKGAPLLSNVGRDLDARINTLLPRLRKLFEPPTAKRSEIEKRVKDQLAAEQGIYARSSIQLAKRRIDLEGQLAREINKAGATKGKSSGVDAAKAAIKANDDVRRELEQGFNARSAAIVDSGYREAQAYDTKQAEVRKRLQDEIETLSRQRGLIDKELKNLDKARNKQRPPTGIDEAIQKQREDGKRFAEGLKARLTEEAKADKTIQKARDAQNKKTPTGIDQRIERQQAEAKAFSAGLKQRLQEEQKALDSAANAAEKAEDKRQTRLRRIRNARRRRELRESRAVPQQLAVFGQDLRQVGTGLFAAGAAGLAGFGLAAREFAELDKVLRSIKGIASATDSEIKSLEVTVRKLGATTSFTTREVATAAQELARGGQSIADIQNSLPGVLDLARGTGSDLTFSAQSVVRTLGQFQLATTETGRVVDALAASANAGTLDLQDLGESMKFLGPIAETTGESVESVGAAFAVMANNGLRGGLAGRQLRRVFYELADPLKRLKILSELGVNTFDPAGNLRPIADLVSEIGSALNELPSGKKVNFLDDIFGEGAAAFEALSKGRKEFRGLIVDIQASEGYAAALAKEIDGGLYGAFLIAVSAVKDFGIEIGKSLGPVLISILRSIQDVAKSLIKFAADNRTLVVTLATMVAIVTALGGTLIGLGASIGVIAAIASAVAILRGQLLLTQLAAIGLAGPQGLAAVALSFAAIAGASYLFAASMEANAQIMEEMGRSAGDLTSKVGRITAALQQLSKQGELSAKDAEKFKSFAEALEAEFDTSLGAKYDKDGNPTNAPEVAKRAGLLASQKKTQDELETSEAELQIASNKEGFLREKLGEARKKQQAIADTDIAGRSAAAAGITAYNDALKDQQAETDKLKNKIAGLNDELGFYADKLTDLPKIAGPAFEPKNVLGAAFGPAGEGVFNNLTAGVGKAMELQLNTFGDDVIGPLAGLAEKYARNDLASGKPGALSPFVAKFADVLQSPDFKNLGSNLSGGVKLFGEQINAFLVSASGFLFENQRTELNKRIAERAEELVSSFDLGGTSRQGAFGIEEAQRQVAGQTTNLLAQALKEEEKTNKLLEDVKVILKNKPGLIGK